MISEIGIFSWIIFGLFIIFIICFAYQNYKMEQFLQKQQQIILKEVLEQPVLLRKINSDQNIFSETKSWKPLTGWKFSWL